MSSPSSSTPPALRSRAPSGAARRDHPRDRGPRAVDRAALDAVLRRHPRGGRGFFSRAELIAGYRHFAAREGFGAERDFVDRVQLRPVRSQSGVTPLTVLTKPFPARASASSVPATCACPRATSPTSPAPSARPTTASIPTCRPGTAWMPCAASGTRRRRSSSSSSAAPGPSTPSPIRSGSPRAASRP